MFKYIKVTWIIVHAYIHICVNVCARELDAHSDVLSSMKTRIPGQLAY